MKKIPLLLALVFLVCSHSAAIAQTEEKVETNDAQVIDFINLSLHKLLSFSYKNYEEKRLENKKYLTEFGHESFYNELKRKKIVQTVIGNKWHLQFRANCKPEVYQGTDENKKTWEVMLASQLLYLSSDGKASKPSVTTYVKIFEQEDDVGNRKFLINQVIVRDEGVLNDPCSVEHKKMRYDYYKWISDDNFGNVSHKKHIEAMGMTVEEYEASKKILDKLPKEAGTLPEE